MRSVGRPGPVFGAGLLLVSGAVLTLAAYRPALRAGFVFDDQPNIVTATALHWTEVSLAALRGTLDSAFLTARPVSNLTFALNHLAGGLDPYGYHLVNVLVHLAVGAVLYWVIVLYLKEGVQEAGRGARAWGAALAVTLFWVHPLNTQAVTYVVQRMTSLAALFGLLSFALYLVGRARSEFGSTLPWLAGAVASWILALGSKENAFALPLVFVLWEACFRRAEWRRRWNALSPRARTGLITGAGVVVISAAVVARGMGAGSLSWSRDWAMRDFNGVERVLTQGRVHLLYLSLLLWPTPGRLALDHDFTVSRGLLDPWTTLLALGFWILTSVAALVLARRAPRFGFPVLAYLALHLVESGPLNLELVFEHRMYLPVTMLAVLVAAAIHDLPGRHRIAAGVLVLAISLPMARATWTRNVLWAEPLAFFEDAARKAPAKYRPQFVLGSALAIEGRLAEARELLTRAARLDPSQSAPHNQLGNIYLTADQIELALAEYRTAVDLDPANHAALFNLGMLLHQQGRVREAEPYLRRFIESAPDWLEEAVGEARRRLETPDEGLRR